jgi:L-rhamnose isomerase
MTESDAYDKAKRKLEQMGYSISNVSFKLEQVNIMHSWHSKQVSNYRYCIALIRTTMY